MIMEQYIELQHYQLILGDSFGGKVKHTREGNIWIFNREIIESLAKEDKSRIIKLLK